MADFKTALIALSNGELSYEVVAKNIEKILAKQPTLAVEILEQLREAYNQSIIDAPHYSRFKAHVAELSLRDDPEQSIAEESRAALPGDNAELMLDFDLSAVTDSPVEAPNDSGDSADRTDPPLAEHSSEASADTGWPSDETAGEDGVIEEKIGPGSVLKDRFQLDEVLGIGGMGTVYRGRDLIKVEARDKNPFVALKILNEDFKKHPDAFIALQREASRQQKLAHPNIATVYDFDRTQGGTFFLTMELLEGEPLNTFIKKTVKERGGLPFDEAFPMIEGLGKALIYAHERDIVHSDLKPGNCFITKDGAMKVLDFGIARAVKTPGQGDVEKTLFDPGKLGALTPAYASAEMLEEKEPDTRDDIYALACVAYELLSGKHPYNKLRATAARDNDLIPAQIKGLKRRQMKALLHGLGFSREERCQTVAEFLDELKGPQSPLSNPLIVVPTAAAILIAAGIFPVMNAIQEREITQLIENLQSGDRQRIESTLNQVDAEGFDNTARDRVLVASREDVLNYFDSKIDDRVNLDAGRYDFAGARSIINRVSQLATYSDSAQVEAWRNDVSAAENTLLNEQSVAFNEALVADRLLNIDGEPDVHDALAAISGFRPDVAETFKTRLPGAYAAAIERAIVNEEFELAVSLSTAGLKILPGDPNLENLADKIAGAQERTHRDNERMRHTATIRDAIAVAHRVGDFNDIQNNVRDLAFIETNSPVLTELKKTLQPMVNAELAQLERRQEWFSSDLMSGNFRLLLLTLGMTTELADVEKHKFDFELHLDTLFNELKNAIAAENDALVSKHLRHFNEIAGAHPRARYANEAVARWYVARARLARALTDLNSAEALLDSGLALTAGKIEVTAFVEERQIIRALSNDNAVHYVQNSEEQDAQFSKINQALKKALESSAEENLDVDRLLNEYDAASATNPIATELESTRTLLHDKILGEANNFAEQDDLIKPTEILYRLLAYFPLNETALRRLGEYRASARGRAGEAFAATIAEKQSEIETMLQSPDADRVWTDRMQQALTELQGIVGLNDPWVLETRSAVAEMYVQKAQQRRREKKFADSDNLLARGERFRSDLQSLQIERRTLASEAQAFRMDERRKERQARIDTLMQDFNTQVQARDAETVVKTFESLRFELGEDTEFLSDTAPTQLAEMYLELAKQAAADDNFADALSFAKRGRSLAVDDPGLNDFIAENTVRGNGQLLAEIFTRGGEFELDPVLEKINEIKSLDLEYFTASEQRWAIAVAERLQRLKQVQGEAANQALTRAKMVFADNAIVGNVTPSVSLAVDEPVITRRLRSALDEALLSKSRNLLQSMSDRDLEHPAIRQLQDVYEARVEEAKLRYEEYKISFDNGNFLQAQRKIEQALAVWQDNNTFMQEHQRVRLSVDAAPTSRSEAKVVDNIPPSDAPCLQKLAGNGKRKSGECYDMISASARGPIMVVIPSGETISTPFAIGKFEITIGDFNSYCRVTGACSVESERDLNLPKTNISADDATRYADWLSKTTRSNYRLPSSAEWLHAAYANGQQRGKDYNCRVVQGEQILKGESPLAVDTAKANGWGLYNYVGNVQELATSGASLAAHGGSHADNFGDCSPALEKVHSGLPDEVTGFRIMKTF